MAPMSKAQEFRNHAEECRQQAEQCSTVVDKNYWLVMADEWLRMAEDAAVWRAHEGTRKGPGCRRDPASHVCETTELRYLRPPVISQPVAGAPNQGSVPSLTPAKWRLRGPLRSHTPCVDCLAPRSERKVRLSS